MDSNARLPLMQVDSQKRSLLKQRVCYTKKSVQNQAEVSNKHKQGQSQKHKNV